MSNIFNIPEIEISVVTVCEPYYQNNQSHKCWKSIPVYHFPPNGTVMIFDKAKKRFPDH